MYLIDIPQLEFIYYKQRAVLAWIDAKYGVYFVITSLYRMEDDGVHGIIPLRGTDLRCHSAEIGMVMKNDINAHWKYDPQRPTKKVCRSHGPEINRPLHLHIQTHPRTYEA